MNISPKAAAQMRERDARIRVINLTNKHVRQIHQSCDFDAFVLIAVKDGAVSLVCDQERGTVGRDALLEIVREVIG